MVRSEFDRLEEECQGQHQLAVTNATWASTTSRHLEDVNRQLVDSNKEKEDLKKQLEKAKSQSSTSERESEMAEQIAKLKRELSRAKGSQAKLTSRSSCSSSSGSKNVVFDLEHWQRKTHQFELEAVRL